MKWFELVILILASLGLFYWVARQRLKDDQFLKKSTKEAISKDLRESLEKESIENKRKKEKFDKLMKDFGLDE